MPPVVHSFDPPDRFVAGTVGEPGARTFFVQARSGERLVSVALEKQQVAILAEQTGELLDKLVQAGDTRTLVPALAPADLVDNGPLDNPIEEEFRAGTITLSWDPDAERVVIEVFAITAVEADPGELDPTGEAAEPEPEEMLVVRLTPGQARAFCARSETVVDAGREQCPFCGGPMDPGGHLCPRANGFKRTAP
ncbi:hypothetical protein GCM10011519_04610 [Marmoricola endophyticus]|uniref:DUF3090 family protein n=1 Tax=Marmoricola endophyticus TaxID=2040280 RepID=A0A917BCL3_9ACTN|nr:DUF3090 family protein [Marmoricola endophyticus]GGF34219.1 hypothetical protein GCM10011519_04610 [Marmoricola endophyticus]